MEVEICQNGAWERLTTRFKIGRQVIKLVQLVDRVNS